MPRTKLLFLSFFIPFIVRAVPEILIGPYVVGFDPMGSYIPFTINLINGKIDFWHLIAAAPLFNVMLAQASLLGVPLNLALKAISPLLHGFLGLAVYLFAKKALQWSDKKSLLVTFMATLYFVALRISWDMLRNELSLIFLFLTLTLIVNKNVSMRNRALSCLAMILVVLSDQYTAIILLVIMATMIVSALIKAERCSARNLTIVTVPSFLLFLLILYANLRISPDFSAALGGLPGLSAEEFASWSSIFGTNSYGNTIATTLSLLAFCYLPLAPFAISGVKFPNNLQLKTWTMFSLIAVFIPLLWPFRWVLMLTYPIAFFATETLTNIQQNRPRKLLSLATVSIVIILSAGFIIMPNETPFPYFIKYPYYIPSSMLQNTVPLQDCKDVENALNWVRNNTTKDTALLAHTAFYGWALENSDKNQTIIPYGYNDPMSKAEKISQQGFNKIYVIWWTKGYGWYGQTTLSSKFQEVYQSNRISIYLYFTANAT
jgi:hypothetical protein